MARTTDWQAMRLAFIHDPNKPTLSDFCVTHGLQYGTAKNRSSREDWLSERDRHWGKVTEKASESVTSLQVTVQARDMAQQLSEIQAMKLHALRYAGGMPDEATAPYEKPAEAVAAYERLTKLERLLVGEATDIIKVEDARQMVGQIIQMIREEVHDAATLSRLSARLTALGDAGPGSRDTPAALN